MTWKILAIVFGWLLCGAWVMRMIDKDSDYVERDIAAIGVFYGLGPLTLLIIWFTIWPARIKVFAKDTIVAWKKMWNTGAK